MKVFPDTNALVAAFATRGLCADLLREIVTRHELIVGEVVLEELVRVLTERIGVAAGVAAEIDRLLRSGSVVARPHAHLALAIRDPDDEWVVAAAVAAGADILVTGDADILSAAAGLPVRALSPRDAWKALREG